MDEIGQILRDAREAKGLSHADVFDKIRITPKFLKAMEEGTYESLPSQTHVRGYLRKYARHLQLDADPLLERYEVLRVKRPKQPAPIKEIEPIPQMPLLPAEPETGTFFSHLNADISSATQEVEPEADWVGRVIIFAFIIFIGLLAWRFAPLFLGEENSDLLTIEGLTEAIQAVQGGDTAGDNLETATVDTLAPETEIDASTVTTTTQLVVPTSRTSGSTALVNEGDDGQVEFVAPEPTRNPLPATIEVIDMQIEVVQNRTWLRVTADDIVVFEGQADQGEIQNYTANDFVNIRTGNAEGVLVTINDIEVGLLGARGQVADQTWETTR